MPNDKQLAQEAVKATGDASQPEDFPSRESELDKTPKAVSEADAIAGFAQTLKYPASVKGQGKKYQGA